LLTNRFGGRGLYLFDEPEAVLSPQRQLAVLARIYDLIEDASQFLIATHSPILMAYPDSLIYEYGPEGVKQVADEETEHYEVTKSFLENPRRMLDIAHEANAA
jgi:predicted ATPase